MRALRVITAAVVLAALSTLGASAAQAEVTSKRVVIQLDNWQW
jgi:ABC-type proline/glycine betaine transport system substrate-binding protein